MHLRTLALALAVPALASCGRDAAGPALEPSKLETSLTRYQSCGDLEADLKEMLRDEARVRFNQLRQCQEGGPCWWWWAVEDTTGGPPPASPSRQEGVDYSGTNNQEAGVDEADFVKTDGYRIYVLNGNRLHLFGVPEFGQLVPEGVASVEGFPSEMFIHRDAQKVVVFSHIDPAALPEGHPLRQEVGRYNPTYGWWWRVTSVSKATVFDVSNPASPQLAREIYFEGSYQTARLVGTSVRLGAYSWLQIPALDRLFWWWSGDRSVDDLEREANQVIDSLTLGDLVPRIYERLPDRRFTTFRIDAGVCSEFFRPEDSHSRGIASIVSLDVLDDSFSFDADHIVSNWPTFYASQTRIYLAEPANDWWWYWWMPEDERTNIHAFDTTVAGETTYLGSGRVLGVLHNQFSMGENAGQLRVATTVNRWNRWWEQNPPAPDNHVYVLELANEDTDEARLAKIGHLSGIAAGERIFSARFVGDKGYLVTFRNVDPLFTIDLSNPTAPRIAGELEIFGFSSYIHPIADGKLLTIGVGGDATGANWRAQISMFDVADFANPTLADVEELVPDGSWGWSEAMWEHKAFTYFAPQKMLAVPLATYRDSVNPDGTYSWEYLSKLELITVDPATGLGHHGTIDHSRYYPQDQYWYYLDIRRSIFMGDFVYALSDRAITAHRVGDLGLAAETTLPGWKPEDVYWWW